MRKALLIALLVVAIDSPAALAQGSGQFAGVTQCWINGVLTPVRGSTCPSTGGGSSHSTPSSPAYTGVSQASYQLGYALGKWLFGGNANPQAELQKQLMMQELARRAAELERLHQEQEARRITAMYNRLYATLKLSGLPDLQMKGMNNGPGLSLKLGDSSDGHVGIKGLPGMYVNDDNKPYGIPGLPGIYTGGPGEGSGLSNSKLALKMGEGSTGSSPAANPAPPPNAPAAATNGPVVSNETGLQLKTSDSNATPTAAPPATFDPSKMSPQQLADVAEMVSKLPPDEQQHLMAMAQHDATAGQPVPGSTAQPSAQAVGQLQQQAAASQAAAAAPGLEDASAKARAGFDTPLGQGAAQAAAITVSGQPSAASARAPASAGGAARAATPPVLTLKLESNSGQSTQPAATTVQGPATPTAQAPVAAQPARIHTYNPNPAGSRVMDCTRGRMTRDRLASGLPVQEEATRRTRAQIEAARKGVEEARAESKAALMKGALDEVKAYAEDVVTSADALRGQITALQDLNPAKRDMLIRTVNTIAFGGEDLYQAGRAGYTAGGELQKKVDNLSHQIATLATESGILEKAGEKLSGELMGPIGELGFRAAKVSIDLGAALGGGMLSKDEQQAAQRNLDIMLDQYARAKDQVSELDRDLNELCR